MPTTYQISITTAVAIAEIRSAYPHVSSVTEFPIAEILIRIAAMISVIPMYALTIEVLIIF